MERRPLKIVWSGQAMTDLREIAAYIRHHSPKAAQKIRQTIKEGTRRLQLFPLSGRIIPELPEAHYREIIVRDYRILYEPTEDRVEILAVLHGSRDLPSLFPRRRA
ncbi:MAG TPA: type II toxin-antitoxin system RelE/ParE family toxin [Chthonomonadaceae bacterium]|nr:type II toxin-antitoxin system RelE/ParE family toxin [Chthonomonadaceae bacterium]